MSVKQGLTEDVYVRALQDPRDMVKAGLLESQSSVALLSPVATTSHGNASGYGL